MLSISQLSSSLVRNSEIFPPRRFDVCFKYSWSEKCILNQSLCIFCLLRICPVYAVYFDSHIKLLVCWAWAASKKAWDSHTLTNESAFCNSNWLMACSIRSSCRRGDVGCNSTIASKQISFFHTIPIACRSTGSVLVLSCASSTGLRKGVLAPKYCAIFAIFSQSVDTQTVSILGVLSACSILQAIRGLPAKFAMFLFGKPLEPARAGITARYFMCRFNRHMTLRLQRLRFQGKLILALYIACQPFFLTSAI